MDQVSSASRLVFLDGRAKGVKADSTGSVDVEVERGDGVTVTLRPGLEVDASGFERVCEPALGLMDAVLQVLRIFRFHGQITKCRLRLKQPHAQTPKCPES